MERSSGFVLQLVPSLQLAVEAIAPDACGHAAQLCAHDALDAETAQQLGAVLGVVPQVVQDRLEEPMPPSMFRGIM
jgi:hypothetical protein